MKPGYMYMWEYIVAPEKLVEFERVYGPTGDWAHLFAEAAGYLRTELHRDRREPCRFVTIDYWESVEAWNAFRATFAERFEDLDARCASLTTREADLGAFGPAGSGIA